MVINAQLREFLHQQGVLGRFIKNVEQQNAHPNVVCSIIGAFRWVKTEEKEMYWFRLHLMWERLRRRPQEPPRYYGDDDTRAE